MNLNHFISIEIYYFFFSFHFQSQILEEKLYDTQLYMEFERIPKRKDNAHYDCALHDENRSKNFDPNFLPYDDNRVRITPTRDNRMGYVNASHITATVGAKQRFYIVAQSPHSPQTLTIFWQCVWEADVYLIVQLSDESNYIPATSNKCLDYGQYQVYQEFSQSTGRCVTSKLRIFHAPSKRYRSVWHLKYTNWAEQNCPPDVEHFLGKIVCKLDLLNALGELAVYFRLTINDQQFQEIVSYLHEIAAISCE